MKRPVMIWTTVLLVLAVALQLWLIRGASREEPYVEVLAAARDLGRYEEVCEGDLVRVKVAADAPIADMFDSEASLLGKVFSRPFKKGEIFYASWIGKEEEAAARQTALRLDPQDAVLFDLKPGEAIELMAVKGGEVSAFFESLRVVSVCSQNLSEQEPPPLYLVVTGSLEDILEICRLKDTHGFQVVKAP